MKNDSNKQIKLGMILSYINLGIGNLIPLFYTPIMLQLLGQSEYGLYKIASSTTSYLSLMTFGVGSAVSRFIIKARTQEGKDAEERMFGLFFLIFQMIAVCVLLVGGILVMNLDVIYRKSLVESEISRMQILVAIMVLNTVVSISSTAYNAIVSSHERFLFIHSLNILSTIAAPLANLIFLLMGYRSIAMALVSLSVNLISRVIYLVYLRNTLHIRPRFDHLPIHSLREILVFSFWIFGGSLAGQLYDATDMVIIGATPALATMGAAIYSVGTTFSHIISSLSQVIPTFFLPKINTMVFSGTSNAELSELVTRVGRMQSYIVALIVSGFIAFGYPFIHWYVGDDYLTAYWIAVIIIIPKCIPLVQGVALAVLRAKNMHKFRTILYLGIAIVNLIATLILVTPLGLIGAAIPTGLSLLIGNGIILNCYYHKKVGLDILGFWKSTLPIFAVSALPCTLTLLLSKLIDFTNPFFLFGGIILYSVIYCVIVWFFVMHSSEKDIIKSLFKP